MKDACQHPKHVNIKVTEKLLKVVKQAVCRSNKVKFQS